MISYMHYFLESKGLLRDFYSQINQGIQYIRYTETQDDFTTKHTHNHIFLYRIPWGCITNIFEMLTLEMYHIVAKEIEAQNHIIIPSVAYSAKHGFASEKFNTMFNTYQEKISY